MQEHAAKPTTARMRIDEFEAQCRRHGVQLLAELDRALPTDEGTYEALLAAVELFGRSRPRIEEFSDAPSEIFAAADRLASFRDKSLSEAERRRNDRTREHIRESAAKHLLHRMPPGMRRPDIATKWLNLLRLQRNLRAAQSNNADETRLCDIKRALFAARSALREEADLLASGATGYTAAANAVQARGRIAAAIYLLARPKTRAYFRCAQELCAQLLAQYPTAM